MTKITFDASHLGKVVDKALTKAAAEVAASQSTSVNTAAGATRAAATPAVATETGLKPGVVADSLELRQASAARTEASLTAYDRKAPFFRWVTQADERVCKVCGPRHNKIYRIGEIDYPAHPNCRCIAEPTSVATALVELAPSLLKKTLPAGVLKAIEAFKRGFRP